MVGGIVGAVAGLVLWALGLTDGWWVLWLGLAGVGLQFLSRVRLESGGGDDGRGPDASGFGYGND
jgi:hypothetical protein